MFSCFGRPGAADEGTGLSQASYLTQVLFSTLGAEWAVFKQQGVTQGPSNNSPHCPACVQGGACESAFQAHLLQQQKTRRTGNPTAEDVAAAHNWKGDGKVMRRLVPAYMACLLLSCLALQERHTQQLRLLLRMLLLLLSGASTLGLLLLRLLLLRRMLLLLSGAHLQVVIITGCNTGLGRESARVLAARGAGEQQAS
jgi:hypothetical protein